MFGGGGLIDPGNHVTLYPFHLRSIEGPPCSFEDSAGNSLENPLQGPLSDHYGSALFAFLEANVMYIPQDPPLVLHVSTS